MVSTRQLISVETLSDVKFIQEKRLIGKYFEEISQDTGKHVFDMDDALKFIEKEANCAEKA